MARQAKGVAHLQGRGEFLELSPHGALAEDDEHGVRLGRTDRGERAGRDVESLLRHEPRAGEQDPGVRGRGTSGLSPQAGGGASMP